MVTVIAVTIKEMMSQISNSYPFAAYKKLVYFLKKSLGLGM